MPDAISSVWFLVSILNMFCSSYRSECSNCEIGEQCGVIMHGSAITFCEPYGPRELVSALQVLCSADSLLSKGDNAMEEHHRNIQNNR